MMLFYRGAGILFNLLGGVVGVFFFSPPFERGGRSGHCRGGRIFLKKRAKIGFFLFDFFCWGGPKKEENYLLGVQPFFIPGS